MRSSDLADRVSLLARQLLVVASVLSTACSPVPVASQSPATSSAPECVAAEGGTSPQDADALASLRRSVETGPFYTISAAKTGVAACRVSREADAMTLEYTFRDGGWLRVKRQPRIEYTDQEVRFASPLGESAGAVLTRAEQAAFGAQGCGIDWRQPEKRPAGDDPSVTEIVYRGDVCNCQAGVRNDAAGRVAGLAFRSAC
jgi:hypothetical protein